MIEGLVDLLRGARDDLGFWHRDITTRLLARYDEATCAEAHALGIERPRHYIFGHTHDHIGVNGPLPLTVRGRQVLLYNTGGWLDTRGDESVAEVFFMDRSGQLSAVEVS